MECERADLMLGDVVVRRPDGGELYTIRKQEFGPGLIALTGPNGSGKSTLLKFIAGLNRTSTGNVSACGVDKQAQPCRFARLISYQMQNFSGYPQMSGFAFLVYLLRLRGFGRSEASRLSAAAMQVVGLDHADVPLDAYSQGMLQRLGIAYILRSGAPVALMDEPFAGIDPQGRADMLDLIEREAGKRTFLICTHHVDELMARGAIRFDIAEMMPQDTDRP